MYDVAKHRKTIGPTAFWSIQESSSKYLMNLSSIYDSGAYLARFSSKKYQDALGSSLLGVV